MSQTDLLYALPRNVNALRSVRFSEVTDQLFRRATDPRGQVFHYCRQGGVRHVYEDGTVSPERSRWPKIGREEHVEILTLEALRPILRHKGVRMHR
ncbi:MAG: hypothetical protein V4481_04515 [Patescibacteria group bacterium]